MQSLSKSQLNLQAKLKIYTEMQGTRNNQNNLEKEQIWMTHTS